MIIIDGKQLAHNIIESLKKLPKPQKSFVAVFVGNNPASASFLKQKSKTAQDLGLEFRLEQVPETISEADLEVMIKKIGEDPSVGGMIIQLPLPPKFDQNKIISFLNSKKDVDALVVGTKVLPLAVGVVKDVLTSVNYQLSDKMVGVVGRGALVGRPIAEWLLGKCREVIIFHTKTGLDRIKDCDLVITGAGKAGLIRPDMLKAGAGVIDFGFDTVDGKIRGDFDTSNIDPRSSILELSFYTPTPGGTGPILVAELFKNFYILDTKYEKDTNIRKNL